MRLYFESKDKVGKPITEELSLNLIDELRKYMKKFLRHNGKEIEHDIDTKGWEKAADDLVREFSIMIDDYFEAVASYGKEEVE